MARLHKIVNEHKNKTEVLLVRNHCPILRLEVGDGISLEVPGPAIVYSVALEPAGTATVEFVHRKKIYTLRGKGKTWRLDRMDPAQGIGG